MPWRTKKGDANNELKYKRRSTFTERFHKTMEAITFAEAGEIQTAKEILQNYAREAPKILVVSHGLAFSGAVMEYSLGFAERMGYEIVALIILPTNKDPSRTNDWFLEVNMNDFRKSAIQRNIPFRYMVKTGETAQCVKEAFQELMRVRFIISDRNSCPEPLLKGKLKDMPIHCLIS